MDWLLVFVLRNLPTARWLGWAVSSIAGAAIGLGLRLARLFDRAARALSRAGADQHFTLATAYPDFPTWWIPETTAGFITWLVIGALSASLAFAAKRLMKQIG